MACILCATNSFSEIGEKRGFTIATCAGCGFVYTMPLPREEELIKATQKKSSNFKPHVSLSRKIRYHFFASRIKRLFPQHDRIRLLEIGCNQGNFLSIIKSDKKFVATGIDLNSAALQYARSQGLNVLQVTQQSNNFSSGSFDVVVTRLFVEAFY